MERKPLLYDGKKIILVLPTAVSIAIRRFVFEWLYQNGLVESFEKNFVGEYIKPVTAGKNESRQIREADLKGHIKSEKEEVDGEADQEMEDLKTDNQLKNAIDLLKNWDIFKEI